jgi:cyclopropane-fatty-acyl-phospholipid synthase
VIRERVLPSQLDRLCENVVRRFVDQGAVGNVRIVDADAEEVTGPTGGQALFVRDPRFYRRVVLGGNLGAAESYLQGEWDTPDLVEFLREVARSSDTLEETDGSLAWLLQPIRTGLNWLHRNTRAGSRRNIAAHYDLNNEFFALMLDPTMTYSSGVFDHAGASMEEASVAKYDRVCRKLELSPDDDVLEIGTGWGGFALYAAKTYGCRITTTTISQQQYEYARERIERAGLSDRIRLLKQDYRDLTGQYDKLVSIEMIEAVGQRFLDGYFAKCSQLLGRHGMMLLQAITIPDHRYDAYRRSVDFIQRYIFPGGFLPCIAAMAGSLRKNTDFRWFHSECLGTHYAETLSRWRHQFWDNIERVRALGFDERFVRMWHYYLCYCEAGFRERQIGVSQVLLTKPGCRRQPVFENV